MIGIDLGDKRGVVAAFHEGRPAILGEAASMEELVRIARARLSEVCLNTTAVLTVPVWFHDEQRKSAADRGRSAGLVNVRLMNRPTAVALAYFALQPADRSELLVLELEDDRFDVAVLSKTPEGFELLASDGNLELNPLLASDPAGLFREIESATQRALKQAGLKREQLSDILCAGRGDRIEAIQSHLADAFGRKGSTQVRPEHAAALGAAVQAGLLARSAGQADVPLPTEPAPRGRGCMVLLVMLLATILFLL